MLNMFDRIHLALPLTIFLETLALKLKTIEISSEIYLSIIKLLSDPLLFNYDFYKLVFYN